MNSTILSAIKVSGSILDALVYTGPINAAVAANKLASYALALPFKTELADGYWLSGTKYNTINLVPGYAYTRSGAKGEINAQTGVDRIDDFAANVAGIVSGKGYFARGALTNLEVQSQTFGARTLSGLTVTADNFVASDGTTTGDLLVSAAAGAVGYTQIATLNFAAGVHTTSVFVKKTGGTAAFAFIQIGDGATNWAATIDKTTGAVSNADLTAFTAKYAVDCGDHWRVVCVYTAAATTTGSAIHGPSDGATVRTSATGSSIGLWQAQTIPGNHPAGGPIIATVAAAVAIGADVQSHTQTAPTNVDQVFFAKVNVGALLSGVRYSMQMDDGTVNNRIALYLDAGAPTGLVTVAGVSQLLSSTTALVASQDTIIVLHRLGGNWRVGKVVAGAITWAAAASAGTFPAGMVNNRIGNDLAGANQLEGYIPNLGHKVGTFTTDAEVISAASI